MRRFLIAAGLVLSLASAAEALTVRDIIELSRAGLGDDVLLALIEVEGRVFTLDNDTLALLKKSGVSDKVIVAMIKSGRTKPAPMTEPEPASAPEPEPAPPVVVIDHHEDRRPSVREVPVAVPVYIPAPVVRRHPRPVQPQAPPVHPAWSHFFMQPRQQPVITKPWIVQPDLDRFNQQQQQPKKPGGE